MAPVLVTLKVIPRFQAFSSAILRTFVQHFTRFQLTACSCSPSVTAGLLVSVSVGHFIVVLYLVSSVPSHKIGWEECLRNDLVCVEWYVKPQLSQAREYLLRNWQLMTVPSICYFVPRMIGMYCVERVCLYVSVCLPVSLNISRELHVQNSPNFLYVLLLAVARFFFISIMIHRVVSVLWRMSFFHTMPNSGNHRNHLLAGHLFSVTHRGTAQIWYHHIFGIRRVICHGAAVRAKSDVCGCLVVSHVGWEWMLICLWRLRDETVVCRIIEDLESFLQLQQQATDDEMCRVYLKRVQHLYYKVCW